MTRNPWTKAWIVPIAMITNTIASMTSTVPLVIATSHSCIVGTSEHLQTSSRPAGQHRMAASKSSAPTVGRDTSSTFGSGSRLSFYPDFLAALRSSDPQSRAPHALSYRVSRTAPSSTAGAYPKRRASTARGDPLSREQSHDDPQGQREMVDDVCDEHDRIDHQTGDDKEARDEQGLAIGIIWFRCVSRFPPA